ncbi:MAG: surface-adhesin E family protein [Telluria sp.]
MNIVLSRIQSFAGAALCASALAIAASAHAAPPKPKFSDDEIRMQISRMNSIKTDMTVAQVVSILGQPQREQLVSSTQRILVYPLSIVVSFYQSSRTGQWQVTSPALYGSPVCVKETGEPQRDRLGATFVEVPGTSCIPVRFFPELVKARQDKAKAAQGTLGAGTWQPLTVNGGVKTFYDARSMKRTGDLVEVKKMTSFDKPTEGGMTTPPYQSRIEINLVNCDPTLVAQQKNVFTVADEYYSAAAGKGGVVHRSKAKPEWQKDRFWWSDDKELTTVACTAQSGTPATVGS